MKGHNHDMFTTRIEEQTRRKLEGDVDAGSNIPAEPRYSTQYMGLALQIGLGILLGFSAIKSVYLGGNLHMPKVDDMCLLLVSMAVLVAATPLPFPPKLDVPCRALTKALLVAGLTWYAIFCATSWIYFHRGILTLTLTDRLQLMALFALCALIITPLVRLSGRGNRCRSAIPLWTLALLAVGLLGLPLSIQLGQLPVCILAFVIAFQAAFLARGLRILFISIIVASMGVLGYGLIAFCCAVPSWSGQLPRFGQNIGRNLVGNLGPNPVGHYLILLAFAGVALFCLSRGKSRLFSVAGIALCVLCLILTQSRGAILGLLVAVAFFVWQGRRIRMPSLRVMIATLVAVAFALALVGHLTAERLASDERPAMLKFAMQMFLRSPIIGNGVGSFHSAFAEYQLAHLNHLSNHLQCHNLIAEILCNAGLLGLLVFGVTFFCCFRLYRRARGLLDSIDEQYALIACAAGILGYISSWMVDVLYWYQTLTPAIPVLIGSCMGFVASKNVPSVPKLAPDRNRMCWVYPSLLVVMLIAAAGAASRVCLVKIPDYREKLSQIWIIRSDPGDFPTGNIIGRIVDERGYPIYGVEVKLSPGGRKAFSDRNGEFHLKDFRKKSGRFLWHARFIRGGDCSRAVVVPQSEHGPTVLNVVLRETGRGNKRVKRMSLKHGPITLDLELSLHPVAHRSVGQSPR